MVNLDALSEPITGSSEAPDDIASLEALATYSYQFDSGQTSLFVFDATSRSNDNGTDNIRDIPVLDEIDRIEAIVSQVEALFVAYLEPTSGACGERIVPVLAFHVLLCEYAASIN